MKKGTLTIGLAAIFSAVMMIILIVAAAMTLSAKANSKDEALELLAEDYLLKRDLNQFLNTRAELSVSNYVSNADLVAGYYKTEGDITIIEQHLIDSLNDYFGGGFYDDKKLYRLNSNVILIAVLGYLDPHSKTDTKYQKKVDYVKNAFEDPLNEALIEKNPEELVARVGNDNEFAIAAANLVSTDGEVITVVMMRRYHYE